MDLDSSVEYVTRFPNLVTRASVIFLTFLRCFVGVESSAGWEIYNNIVAGSSMCLRKY